MMMKLEGIIKRIESCRLALEILAEELTLIEAPQKEGSSHEQNTGNSTNINTEEDFNMLLKKVADHFKLHTDEILKCSSSRRTREAAEAKRMLIYIWVRIQGRDRKFVADKLSCPLGTISVDLAATRKKILNKDSIRNDINKIVASIKPT